MATYTSNYGWTKPSGSDNVDISVLNDNLDDQDSTIHDAFLNMAPPFSESSTYAVDDIVLYGTGLYKCHTAVVTPGSWTGSTNWQVYKLSEGGSGGGGTSNYNDLTNKPSINGVTLSGNKTTSDLGIDKTAVGLGNVPNVSTNDQTPTFTEASTRNNIASGEKLSVIMGKIQKFFNDLKTVAFSGSYTDLSNKPQINSVELSGNKTSSQLGVANASTVISWDDWNRLTPQQQETGNYTITDCPWADGNVSVDLMTKLWENPDVTQSFAAQYVDLTSSDFDLFLVIASYSNSATSSVVSLIANDKGGYISYAYPGSTGASSYSRQFTVDKSTNKVRFYDASTASGTTAAVVNNARLIPVIIYGIKTTASVKINAIAMDVSTSADKCMMSDGTSVEDRIDGQVFTYTADGVKTYAQCFNALFGLCQNAIDISKWQDIRLLQKISSYSAVNIFLCNVYSSSQIKLQRTNSDNNNFSIATIILTANSSAYLQYSNAGGTVYTEQVPENGMVFCLIVK